MFSIGIKFIVHFHSVESKIISFYFKCFKCSAVSRNNVPMRGDLFPSILSSQKYRFSFVHENEKYRQARSTTTFSRRTNS